MVHHELLLRRGNYVVLHIMNCCLDKGTMWCGNSRIVVEAWELCDVVHHEL